MTDAKRYDIALLRVHIETHADALRRIENQLHTVTGVAEQFSAQNKEHEEHNSEREQEEQHKKDRLVGGYRSFYVSVMSLSAASWAYTWNTWDDYQQREATYAVCKDYFDYGSNYATNYETWMTKMR